MLKSFNFISLYWVWSCYISSIFARSFERRKSKKLKLRCMGIIGHSVFHSSVLTNTCFFSQGVLGWVTQTLWAFLMIIKTPPLSSQCNWVQRIKFCVGWVHVYCMWMCVFVGARVKPHVPVLRPRLTGPDLSCLTAGPRDWPAPPAHQSWTIHAHHQTSVFFLSPSLSLVQGMEFRQVLDWQLATSTWSFFIPCVVGGWVAVCMPG